jgi:hypothetical protein
MVFKKLVTILIIAGLLIVILSASLFSSCSKSKESFDIVPIATDPYTKQIVNGYYQVDDTNMALVPYGFAIDPTNPRKILPKTKVAHSMLTSNSKTPVPIPKPGEWLTDGYYFINTPYLVDSSLAVLPPNMKPNVERIEFTTDAAPRTLIYYTVGYTSETEYYQKRYNPDPIPRILPKGVYYTDISQMYISLLPFGMVADMSDGYGFKPDPTAKNAKFNNVASSYNNIRNAYNTEFHDSEDMLKKQNTMNDISFGEVRVRDQSGNMIILPRVETQGSTTYYTPGEFPFGSSAYVPNYEDSVYLSSIGYRSMFGNVHSTT